MRTFTLTLTADEVAIIGDSLSDMVDELETMTEGGLLLEKTRDLLKKVEKFEQTDVFPH